MMDPAMARAQQAICTKYGAPFLDLDLDLKVGAAANLRSGLQPLNGLRHRPEGGTTGWYLWAGEELSQADDFFLPLCARHLEEWCPQVLPYLGLAPGWRFLIVEGYADVWFDEALLRSE